MGAIDTMGGTMGGTMGDTMGGTMAGTFGGTMGVTQGTMYDPFSARGMRGTMRSPRQAADATMRPIGGEVCIRPKPRDFI